MYQKASYSSPVAKPRLRLSLAYFLLEIVLVVRFHSRENGLRSANSPSLDRLPQNAHFGVFRDNSGENRDNFSLNRSVKNAPLPKMGGPEDSDKVRLCRVRRAFSSTKSVFGGTLNREKILRHGRQSFSLARELFERSVVPPSRRKDRKEPEKNF